MMETNEIIKGLREEVQKAREDVTLVMEVNVKLRKELRMMEKLLELNMKDLHDIVDQRDWYYEEYRKLKDRLDVAQKMESQVALSSSL
jgi:cell shape-determining protein MreC